MSTSTTQHLHRPKLQTNPRYLPTCIIANVPNKSHSISPSKKRTNKDEIGEYDRELGDSSQGMLHYFTDPGYGESVPGSHARGCIWTDFDLAWGLGWRSGWDISGWDIWKWSVSRLAHDQEIED
ncbi:hypothetical protein MYU51_014081 [Penicillium brevicompactum]